MKKNNYRNRLNRHGTHHILGIAASTAIGLAGTAIGAGTSIYGAVSGGERGGGGGGMSPEELRNRISKEYRTRMKRWKAYWDVQFPKMNAAQQSAYQKTTALLESYQAKFEQAYTEQNMERVTREFVQETANLTGKTYESTLADIEQLKQGELDPVFAQRVTEAEHERTRDYADALNAYFSQGAREVARGGRSGINQERRDEAVAGAMARFMDESRTGARKQVEDTLRAIAQDKATAGKEMLGQRQQLIPQFGNLAAGERARIEAGLRSGMGFDAQQIANELGLATWENQMARERSAEEPIRQDIDRIWRSSLSGQQPAGRSDAQTVADIGEATSSALDQFFNVWQQNQSRSTDPGGQVGNWWY